VYSTKPNWGSDAMPAGSLAVHELFWTDPSACAALWSDLLSRDLVTEVTARMRPADDPMQHMLVDPRRTRTHLTDGLWVRLVDVPAALQRRVYASDVDMVLEVTDRLLPANQARWRLVANGLADGGKAECERTTAEPDVALPVSALGAAYLGGARLGGLVAAGQISELRPGAVSKLSAAMYWDPAPWSPLHF
jgi:predicted acetyltransferase